MGMFLMEDVADGYFLVTCEAWKLNAGF